MSGHDKNYWFVTYYKHYIKDLRIIKLTYDSCFLYKTNHKANSTKIDFESFEIVNMQINNTLILVNNKFAKDKEKAIRTFEIIIKKRD